MNDAEMINGILEELEEVSATAMYVADYETDELLYLNHVGAEILGVDADQAVGKKCYEFLMHNKSLCSFCHKAELSEKTFNYQSLTFPLNQHQYRIRSKVFMWNGRKVHAHFISDEAEYLNSHTSVQAIIDQIPSGVGVYHVYPNGSICHVYNNDGYYKIIGSSREKREKYSGLNVINAVHPGERENCIKILNQAIKEDKQFNIELRICKDDGTYKWIALKADIVEKKRKYVTMYASMSDIDQLKRMQEETERNQAEIQMATDRAGILYWIYKVDAHQTVITSGKGYGYDTVIDNVPEVFRGSGDIHPEDEKPYFELFEKMQQGVETCETDARIFNHILNKYQWQHVAFSKISENRYVGSSLDISEQKRVEEKYNNELFVRQELLQDSIVSYRLNLTRNIVEEKRLNHKFCGIKDF